MLNEPMRYLETLTQYEASPLSFAGGCAALNRMHSGLDREVADRIAQILASWPDDLRTVYFDIPRGEVGLAPTVISAYASTSCWKHIRSLYLKGAAQEIVDCLRAVDTRHITTLLLDGPLEETALGLLSEEARFLNLRMLILRGLVRTNLSDGTIARFCSSRVARQLRGLSLFGLDRSFPPLFNKLLTSGDWPELATLSFPLKDQSMLQALSSSRLRPTVEFQIIFPDSSLIPPLLEQRSLAERVSELSTFRLSPDALRAILTAESLVNLKSLSLQQCLLHPPLIDLLRGSAFREKLEHLALLGCDLAGDSWDAVEPIQLPSLTTLRIAGLRRQRGDSTWGVRQFTLPNHESQAGVESLCRLLVLPRMKSLVIQDSLVPGLLEQLPFKAWNVQNWKHLALLHNPIGDQGVRTVANLELRRLRSLEVSGAQASPDGLTSLAGARMPLLHTLILSANEIDPSCASSLARSGLARTVAVLELINVQLTDEALDRLFPEECWPRLIDLDLSYNRNLSPRGLEKLFSKSVPFRLLRINLAGLKFDEAAIKALLAWEGTCSTIHLNLSRCHLPEKTVELFSNSPLIESAEKIDLDSVEFNPSLVPGMLRLPNLNPLLRARLMATSMYAG